MARWVIFNTLQRANQAVTSANNRLRQAFTNMGWTVVTGGVVGKGLDGSDRSGAQLTTEWATPRQRLSDNKWCLPHPETHPLRDTIVEAVNNQTWTQYIIGEVDPSQYVIEEEQPGWWQTIPPLP